MRVLGALFRRLLLARPLGLHDAGKLAFFGSLAHLADRYAFLRHLAPFRKKRWIVHAKPPFAGPEAVLVYLSRYTLRVAISNSRLTSFDQRGVIFHYKDFRRSGANRQQVMMLRRRKDSLALAGRLLAVAPSPEDNAPEEPPDMRPPFPCCGGNMIVIKAFAHWQQPRAPPPAPSPNRKIAS